MQAVHFGAGNIGRGFIGSLLYQSGYETCFIDVNEELVSLINEKKSYTVQFANEEQTVHIVKNVRAINSVANPDLAIDAICHANLVTAAVGPTILPHIAVLLAKGLKQRLTHTKEPLTIIACENMVGGSDFLKEKVYEQLNAEEIRLFDQYFSFPNSAVDRIVPNRVSEDKLAVTVEPFYEWVVDESAIFGERPPVQGITFVQHLEPYIERKLFTVNTGHATAAYFGYQAGVEVIYEALKNESIRQAVTQVLEETGKVLVEKYKFNAEAHQAYIEKNIERFANSFIIDETIRVGRSPIRKLQANDRFLSPAQQYVDLFGEVPQQLTKAIAAAFCYDYAEDPEAVKIQETIQQQGIDHTIETFTGLQPNATLFIAIHDAYEALIASKTII